MEIFFYNSSLYCTFMWPGFPLLKTNSTDFYWDLHFCRHCKSREIYNRTIKFSPFFQFSPEVPLHIDFREFGSCTSQTVKKRLHTLSVFRNLWSTHSRVLRFANKRSLVKLFGLSREPKLIFHLSTAVKDDMTACCCLIIIVHEEAEGLNPQK